MRQCPSSRAPRPRPARLLGAAVLVLALLSGGCKGEKKAALPDTPEKAFTALAAALRDQDAARVYRLLDTPSQWSLMSILRDHKAACELIQKHYPPDRQARALRRCQPGAAAPDAQSLFVSLAPAAKLLPQAPAARAKIEVSGQGARKAIAAGDQRLVFCEENEKPRGKGWAYCGLRETLEQMKIKTARDLATTKDNAETYKGR